jgi:hypothetical protein
MIRIAIILLATALLGSGSAVASWFAKPVDSQASKCSLESRKTEIFDGYQNTTIYIIVDGVSVAVKSASVLDPGFSDIHIQVDKKTAFPVDKVIQNKTALFDSNYAAIIEQFIAGIEVKVNLRFWPTWPATGVHSAKFSLIGFTKALKEMSDCR